MGTIRINGAWPAAQIAQTFPFKGWAYRGVPGQNREYSWTYRELGADTTETPDAMVSLHSGSQSYFVVLKTVSGACVRQLRHELHSQKLEPVAVTCLDCEGVRYTAKDYTVNIYSNKKGPYPYAVVLRRTSVPMLVDNSLGNSRATASPAPSENQD